jgi:hypothetical protein
VWTRQDADGTVVALLHAHRVRPTINRTFCWPVTNCLTCPSLGAHPEPLMAPTRGGHVPAPRFFDFLPPPRERSRAAHFHCN